jgi:ferredoxin
MIENSCTSCELCEKNCPMQIAPHIDKDNGRFGDTDCVKCGTCLVACPEKALSFESEKGCRAAQRQSEAVTDSHGS